MDLKFQKSAIDELKQLASNDRHSVLIEGVVGSGKSFLAKYYGQLCGFSDFVLVQPTVQSIRDALDASYNLTSPVLFCIENLDTGVPAASFTLLKFLEEPTSNVYIVVTCRNRFKLPDTIISRSTCVSLSVPITSDIQDYAEIKDVLKYRSISTQSAWKGVRNLKDVDYVFRLNPEQVKYYDELKQVLNFKDPVSTIIWKLGHYNDNTETDITFVLNYMMGVYTSKRIQKYLIECIRDISTARIASHAVLAKFLLECKYGE